MARTNDRIRGLDKDSAGGPDKDRIRRLDRDRARGRDRQMIVRKSVDLFTKLTRRSAEVPDRIL